MRYQDLLHNVKSLIFYFTLRLKYVNFIPLMIYYYYLNSCTLNKFILFPLICGILPLVSHSFSTFTYECKSVSTQNDSAMQCSVHSTSSPLPALVVINNYFVGALINNHPTGSKINPINFLSY